MTRGCTRLLAGLDAKPEHLWRVLGFVPQPGLLRFTFGVSEMFNAKISSKGRIVIPKLLRDRWGIGEGAVISFTEDAHGLHLRVQRDATRADILSSLQAGLGLAAKAGTRIRHGRTPAQMREGIRSTFRTKSA